jgi:hypothetical protein
LVTKGDGAVDFSPVTFHAIHFRITTTNIDVSSAHYSYHRHPAIRVVAPDIDTHSIANSNRGQGPITPIFMLEVKGEKSGMYVGTCYLVFTFPVPLENDREDFVKNREPVGCPRCRADDLEIAFCFFFVCFCLWGGCDILSLCVYVCVYNANHHNSHTSPHPSSGKERKGKGKERNKFPTSTTQIGSEILSLCVCVLRPGKMGPFFVLLIWQRHAGGKEGGCRRRRN